jgi:hypothetical protein
MNVKIKSFDVNMDVKKKGIELEVRTPNGDSQLGDCYVTMTGLLWCQGKTNKKNGIKIEWNDLINLMSSKDSLKRALDALKNPTYN